MSGMCALARRTARDLTPPARRTFGALGRGSRVAAPGRVTNPERVRIGRGVVVRPHTWLSVVAAAPGRAPLLTIGDGTEIGPYCAIACIGEVSIGRRVHIGAAAFVGDCYHDYRDPGRAVLLQPMSAPEPVRVGDGARIGDGAVVLPGVTVGEDATICAGAVVTRDVAVGVTVAGNPARAVDTCPQGAPWAPAGFAGHRAGRLPARLLALSLARGVLPAQAFIALGAGSVVVPPAAAAPATISLGDDVVVHEGLGVAPVAGGPALTIGSGARIGRFASVRAAGPVIVGARVLTADHVTFGGAGHGEARGGITVGDGAFLGFGSRLADGVEIGENAYVAAGAVVTRDVPARTVVAGSPARIVRRWDGATWVSP